MAHINKAKDIGENDFLSRFLTPSSVGTITAATVALYPLKYGDKGLQTLQVGFTEQWSSIRDLGPVKIVTALVGFALGYGMMKGMSWAKWRLIRTLLSYQGWLYSPASFKTKAWAMALKYLEGTGPHGTYDFQGLLPHQPLPDLEQSLDKFLKVAKLLVSEEDLQTTKTLVEDFRKNEGPKLQAHLQKKADTETSWLSDYWLQVAYLSGRDPLLHSNYYVSNRMRADKPVKQLARTAANIYALIDLERQIRTGKLPPLMLNDVVPLCMAGCKNLFSTTRIPGEHIDTLQTSPFQSSQHVIVIRKGHYFKLPVYVEDDKGELTPLNRNEIHSQLQCIVDETEALEYGASVAALTSQERTTWSKQRELLKLKNEATLDDLERSMFIVWLDTDHTVKMDEFVKYILTGDGRNRWFDKSINLTMNANGDHGVNVEHTGIDAYVFMAATEFMFASEKYAYTEDGELKKETSPVSRQLSKPTKMHWDLENLNEEISQACTSLKKLGDSLDIGIVKAPYGKGFMKKQRMSPDGFIQMSLQLAYYRLHKEIPKTYEPATSRLFALGRTETLHPASEHSIEWVKAMDDKSVSKERKLDLLRKSIKHQNSFRVDSTAGQGFDRHLIGLYCAARELGVLPKLFMDKTFRMPFKLSTSQTPTKIWSLKLDVDYWTCGGGFAPTAPDGYGICYPVVNDVISTYHITCWKQSGRCVKQMGDAIVTAMKDMEDICS